MNLTTALEWLRQPWTIAVAWTLLHSLWQLAAIALIAGSGLTALRRATAEARYVLATALLVLMGLVPLRTFAWLLQQSRPAPQTSEQTVAPPAANINAAESLFISATPAPAAALSPRLTANTLLQPILPCLAWIYLLIATLLILRLLAGYNALRHIVSSGTPLTTPNRAALERLQQKMQITRHIRLIESDAVEVPTVLGLLRPLILLPASALTDLCPDHLEALLAHELAHIRRHDYFANALQSLLESLLFYHPAVWWLSRIIREEREHCCDDTAANVIENKATYASALLSMESLRAAPPAVPPGIVVGARTGSLLQRVRRLLEVPPRNAAPRPVANASSAIATIALLTFLVYLMSACAQHPIAKPEAKGNLKSAPHQTATGTKSVAEETAGSIQTREFDVRDLLILPSAHIPSPAVVIGPEPAAPRVNKDSLNSLIRQLINTIEGNVDPQSWKDHGGKIGEIAEFNGSLVIRQTNENFLRIGKLLKLLRDSHDLTISVESRIFLVNDDLFQHLADKYPSLLTGVVHANALPADSLSDNQLGDFLKETQNARDAMSVATPRVTVFNGQHAIISIERQRGFVAKSSDTPPRGILSTVSTGIVLSLQPVISTDRHSVAVQADLETRTLLKMKYLPQAGPDGKVIPFQEPEVEIKKVPTLFSLKDGNTAIFGGVEALPLQLPEDPTRPKNEATLETRRHIIVLVRPKIIEHPYDKTIYDLPTNPAAPSTHPVK